MIIELLEDERQAILLALAHLAVERPGWCDYLTRVSRRLEGEVFFAECHASRTQGCTAPVPAPPGSTPASRAQD